MTQSEDRPTQVAMKDDMLSPVDRDAIVDLLEHGDNSPRNIADNTDRNASSVSRRLGILEEKGIVKNKGSGVWTLTYEGILMARTVRNEFENND